MALALNERHPGNAQRLSRVVELMEACIEIGEDLDPAVARAVMEDAEQVLLAEKERFEAHGGKVRESQPHDERDACALIASTRILYDVATTMALRKDSHSRMMRTAMKYRDAIMQDIVKPLLLGMPREEAAAIMASAAAWQYTLWSPEHIDAMKQMLEAVAQGGYIRREVRETARYFMVHFTPTTDLDLQRKEAGEGGAG